MTFEEIQSEALTEWTSLNESDIPNILIGTSTCGLSSGAKEVLDYIRIQLEEQNIEANIVETGCMGLCRYEPLLIISRKDKPNIAYGNVTLTTAKKLISDSVLKDGTSADLALCTMGEGVVEGIPQIRELPLFKSQVRIALRNCGLIDPENIKHYIALKGYSGLVSTLNKSAEEVLEDMRGAGLRGKGGAGFSTAEKWRDCREEAGDEKYIICNAAEGDPGAFTAMVLLESDPHSVLEGIVIAAYAAGCSRGIIYVNPEYGLAVARLETALKQMEDCGLLGMNILDSEFSFHLEVIEAAGSIVNGEETSLIRSLEGWRGMPQVRPPYPEISGYMGKPTVINNVETLAHVSAIMQNGPEWYTGYGSDNSKGTKVFTLAGNVANPGQVELPLGMTLREVIFDIGGGVLNGGEFKAVQTGGPTGGWLSEEFLDIAVDYDSLSSSGTIMGSGSLMVADSKSCAVDLARHSLSFIETESCGKCVFCREGTMQLAEILTDISEGRGRPNDIDLLVELGGAMQIGSFCNFGKSAPNPVLTTIRNFREEYEAHIKGKKCPAGVCNNINR